MKMFFNITIALLPICYSAGCQQSAAPPRSATPTTSQTPSNPAASTPDKGESSTSNADQLDDPGMTTDHDKTIKQEQPSGDESSRAAPNEGDAEPPQ